MGKVRAAEDELESVNAPMFDPRDEKTMSEAAGEHLHGYEPGDLSYPSSPGASPIGGVTNCGVCVR